MNSSVIKNPLEIEDTTPSSGLGLENIPIPNGESYIEFSYSSPEKIFNLPTSLTKWSPKIHDVVSIPEDLVEISSDEENRSDEVVVGDHTVFIDEDAVKQEELIDENADESFENEITYKSPKKVTDDLNSSFDVNKVKQEYNIKDNLSIVLKKITNFDHPSISSQKEKQIKRIARGKDIHNGNSRIASKLQHKQATSVPRKSFQLHSKQKSSSKKSVKDNQPLARHPNNSRKAEKSHSKNQIHNANQASNKRHSLRLSGKSPEVTPVEELSFKTRSGKKRVYEEFRSRAISNDKSEYRRLHNSSKISVKTEPDSEIEERPRSPSPSKYRKNVDVMYVCVFCKQKYVSLDHVKRHIKIHFPSSVVS